MITLADSYSTVETFSNNWTGFIYKQEEIELSSWRRKNICTSEGYCCVTYIYLFVLQLWISTLKSSLYEQRFNTRCWPMVLPPQKMFPSQVSIFEKTIKFYFLLRFQVLFFLVLIRKTNVVWDQFCWVDSPARRFRSWCSKK